MITRASAVCYNEPGTVFRVHFVGGGDAPWSSIQQMVMKKTHLRFRFQRVERYNVQVSLSLEFLIVILDIHIIRLIPVSNFNFTFKSISANM